MTVVVDMKRPGERHFWCVLEVDRVTDKLYRRCEDKDKNEEWFLGRHCSSVVELVQALCLISSNTHIQTHPLDLYFEL